MDYQTKFDPNDTFLSLKEVQEIIPLSKSRIYALISKGDFVKPIKLSVHKSCWLKSEIISYAQARLDERNNKM